MTEPRSTPTAFTVGPPIAAGFAIYLRAFLPFTAVALAFALPTVLWSISALDAPSPSSLQAYRVGASLLGIVLASLTTAVLVHATFTLLRGRELHLLTSLRAAFAHLLPLLGAAFISALLIVLGLFLFVVPGLIVMCILYVAIPACLVERLPAVDALKRSAVLTEGNRWPIFGIALIFAVVQGGLAMLLDHLLEEGALERGLYFVLGTASQVVLTGFGAAVTTVVYYQLRQLRESATLEQIAATFE